MFGQAVIFLVVVASGVALCPSARAADEAGSNPLGRGAEVVAAGRDIYNKNCTVCHGMEGEAGDRPGASGGARLCAADGRRVV